MRSHCAVRSLLLCSILPLHTMMMLIVLRKSGGKKRPYSVRVVPLQELFDNVELNEFNTTTFDIPYNIAFRRR